MIGAALRRSATLAATAAVCVLLFAFAAWRYEGFASLPVVVGLVADNAFLGIAAVGMTFVILSGGIDLSVGAVVGCTSVTVAVLIEHAGWHPAPAAALVLALGGLHGAAQGGLIHAFALPPFIVTLAGMFFVRGLGFIVSQESVAIHHGVYPAAYDLPATAARGLGASDSTAVLVGQGLPVPGLVFVAVLVAGIVIARRTRFGRNVYAVGGSAAAARLMGLPVGRTTIGVYALSGVCSALAGLVYSLYTFSGNPSAGTMLELDAIAVVVIGGTLLTGGVGSVAGTLLGVVILGIIQTAIIFDGRLSSWWTRIAIGGLLLAFILLQRGVQAWMGGGLRRRA